VPLQNELARGKTPLALSRMVRNEWGDFKESSKTVFAMQLTRMRKYMALGKLGKTLHGQIEAKGKPDIRALKGPNLDVFQELVGLTKMQRLRVQALWDKEIATNKTCPALNNAVTAYRDLLLSVRRMKLELGIEEELEGLCKSSRPFGNAEKARMAASERALDQSMDVVDEIFRKRGITGEQRPTPTPVESDNRLN
jgi:hypothetical protein